MKSLHANKLRLWVLLTCLVLITGGTPVLARSQQVVQTTPDDYPVILINEFLAQGTEWVELYNPNPEGVNLEGYYLTDGACGDESSYSAFGNISITAKQYLLVNSGDDGENFSLGDSGDMLYLCNPDDQAVDSVGFGTSGGAPVGFVAGAGIEFSTARTPDGADTDDYAADWNLDIDPTPGTANDAPGVDLGGGLIINEISSGGIVELYNPTILPIDAGTYAIAKDDLGMQLLPSAVVGVKQTASVALTHPSVTFTDDNVIYLFNPSRERVDQLSFHGISPSMSYTIQRIGDGMGPNDGYDWTTSGGGVTLFDLPDTLGEYNMITTIESTVQASSMVVPGDVLTYTITMSNSFEETISPISLEDTLPDGMAFLDWITTPYTDTVVASNVITWTGEMEAESSITWEFTAKIGPMEGPATATNAPKLIYYSYEATAGTDFDVAGSLWMPMLLKVSPTK